MAFVKCSNDYAENSKTLIDNEFFKEYLPNAPSEFIKVYLYCVYIAGQDDNVDNSLENFTHNLNITEFELMTALQYWQNEGLLQMYDEPVKVMLLPIKTAIKSDRKWNKSKFEEFNMIVQDLRGNTMVSPNEYNAYYETMEKYHIDIPSMILMIKFCVEFKAGEAVGYKYIISVVRNWAEQGIITQDKIQDKIDEFYSGCDATVQILKALGSKKKPSFEERNLYEKWIVELGFEDSVIKAVAKSIKYNKTFITLDMLLTKYYELKLTSQKEIEEYEKNKDLLLQTAKNVCKRIGVYYGSFDNVIEKYILPWQTLGYDTETLSTISDYCFKNNIRNLDGMDGIIHKFYKSGVISTDSLLHFMDDSIKTDNEIKNILSIAGVIRNVNSWDRDFWRTWTYTWNIPKELIEYGASLACGKTQTMQYLNKILSTWKEQKIQTVDEAKRLTENMHKENSNTETIVKKNLITREYTKEELDSAFSSLDQLW